MKIRIYNDFKKAFGGQEKKLKDTFNFAVNIAAIDGESIAKLICRVSNTWTTKGSGPTSIIGRLKSGKGFLVSGSFKRQGGGRLRASLNRGANGNIFKFDKNKHVITYGSNLPYADSILGDTEPYDIKPRLARYLYFAISSKLAILTKKVTHPGGIKLTGRGGKGGFSLTAMQIEKNAGKYLIAALKEGGFLAD